MHNGFLFQAFVYLAAAVLAVTVAKRFGMGSVLGYLLAGAAIGPHVLGLVGGGGDVMHFAEFGVVMMLFLIGLELRPGLLWRLRVPVLGMGGAQLSVTALLVSGAALALGLPWKPALALGLILAMSSTAIVLQSLQERKWLKSRGGQASFSVLLFQDIAVIPILALIPLLAASAASPSGGHGGPLESLASWQQALVVLGAVAGVVAGGRFLARPVFRFIAGAGLREVFTAFALLLVISISLLMQTVGLSPALGAFLAGVVLADSEYRHELESDIEPFKGLLLGLFFVSVGAGMDFPFILDHAAWVAVLVIGVMVLKFAALSLVAKVFLRERGESLLFSLSLAQVGEFAFVLFALAGSLGVLDGEWTRLGVAVTALSMVASPPLFLLLDRILPRKAAKAAAGPTADAEEPEPGAAILAGFGRMGNIVGRLLMASGIKTTVLDLNPELVENSRKLGLKAYYGDASRLELLHAAGAAQAKVLIVAIKNPEKAMEIAQLARKHFPHLAVLVRAAERVGAYALINAGFDHVYRETFGTALQMGEDALRHLGIRAHTAHRAALAFRRHNESALRELARHWGGKNYWTMLRSKIEEAEGIFRDRTLREQVEAAWDNEALREAAGKGELRR